MHINDNSKPLILLGSNVALQKILEVCAQHNIDVAGILDKDYWGNTDCLYNVPIIDSEDNIGLYKNDYNFFCATNWIPANDLISIRNKEKRVKLIELIETNNLPTISLIDKSARVSPFAKIGKGVYIDSFVLIEPQVEIGNYSNIYAYSGIGHHTVIMTNCVIQRHCSVTGYCTFEDNVYLGTAVKALKTGSIFGKGSFINEGVYIRRGTVPEEIVSITGKNTKRLIAHYVD
jgi:acetyltransferase-like isoleucine patch superfamily enzyme